MIKTRKHRAKNEELVFLEMFYHKYVDRLLNYSYGFLKSKVETEEAVQDIFVKFWNKRSSVDDEEAYEAYLFTIAKHHLLNLLRKKAKESFVVYESEKHSKKVGSVELQFIYQEQIHEAEQIVSAFPEKRKLVYELKQEQGLTNKQIAKKMEISTTMVEKHWRKALGTLKDHFSNISNYMFLLLLTFF
ncbi:MAG: sigma-70 family RNA polymerase sigma factor [Cyclobacteriaceae bacterium]